MTREELIERITDWYNLMVHECYVEVEDGEALDMVIKALEQTRWVPVSERLPEEGTYLCTLEYALADTYSIHILSYAEDLFAVDEFDFYDKKGQAGFYDYDSEYGHYQIDNVVAWMPLPEPYKAE